MANYLQLFQFAYIIRHNCIIH